MTNIYEIESRINYLKQQLSAYPPYPLDVASEQQKSAIISEIQYLSKAKYDIQMQQQNINLGYPGQSYNSNPYNMGYGNNAGYQQAGYNNGLRPGMFQPANNNQYQYQDVSNTPTAGRYANKVRTLEVPGSNQETPRFSNVVRQEPKVKTYTTLDKYPLILEEGLIETEIRDAYGRFERKVSGTRRFNKDLVVSKEVHDLKSKSDIYDLIIEHPEIDIFPCRLPEVYMIEDILANKSKYEKLITELSQLDANIQYNELLDKLKSVNSRFSEILTSIFLDDFNSYLKETANSRLFVDNMDEDYKDYIDYLGKDENKRELNAYQKVWDVLPKSCLNIKLDLIEKDDRLYIKVTYLRHVIVLAKDYIGDKEENGGAMLRVNSFQSLYLGIYEAIKSINKTEAFFITRLITYDETKYGFVKEFKLYDPCDNGCSILLLRSK